LRRPAATDGLRVFLFGANSPAEEHPRNKWVLRVEQCSYRVFGTITERLGFFYRPAVSAQRAVCCAALATLHAVFKCRGRS
jgi:hypothetical protein